MRDVGLEWTAAVLHPSRERSHAYNLTELKKALAGKCPRCLV